MGQQTLLLEQFSDTSMKKIHPDEGMSDGTLFLMDVGHSMGQITGVAAGTVVPNIARDIAADVLGVAASATDGVVAYTTGGPSEILVERTAKKGVHILPSQVNQVLTTNRWYVPWPAALRSHIFNHTEDRAFYFSVVLRVTRVGLTQTSPATPAAFVASPASSSYLFHMQGLTGGPASGSPKLLGRFSTPSLGLGGVDGMVGVGVNGFTGTKPADVSSISGTSHLAGGGAVAGFGSAINKNAGWIIYRAKCEDLSLTKRANSGLGGTAAEEYAAALAQDQSDLAKAFGVGGRFYNDSGWTDPATFP